MRILLTNDDGIEAEGINALYKELSKKHDCIVIAPDGERSASGHSLSIQRDLYYTKTPLGYAISGTPADCVKVGILSLLDSPVDLVVSGINNGTNLGTDVMYSGTVSAAFEAAYLGVRGIAISLAKYNAPSEYYEEAAKFLSERIEKFATLNLSVQTILNINYPVKVPYIGMRFTASGINLYDDTFITGDSEGSLRLKGKAVAHDLNAEDCDVELIKKGYATVTPLKIDQNDYDSLEYLKGLKNF